MSTATATATAKKPITKKVRRVIIDDEDPPVPVGAVMAKLKENTSQRNDANATNHYLSNRLQSLMNTQFKTFGRLVKYDPSVFEEVIKYAEDNNVMIHIDSHIIGKYSVMGEYTTKAGKKFIAHYTINGHYIRKAEKDENPISYKGYFPYNKFKHLFKINTTNTEYNCFEDFIERL